MYINHILVVQKYMIKLERFTKFFIVFIDFFIFNKLLKIAIADPQVYLFPEIVFYVI